MGKLVSQLDFEIWEIYKYAVEKREMAPKLFIWWKQAIPVLLAKDLT